MESRSNFSKAFMSLCLNVLTLAPLSRTPNRIEAWLNSSEMTKQPLLTKAGIVVEFVAKPIDTTMADSTPMNFEIRFSHCR